VSHCCELQEIACVVVDDSAISCAARLVHSVVIRAVNPPRYKASTKGREPEEREKATGWTQFWECNTRTEVSYAVWLATWSDDLHTYFSLLHFITHSLVVSLLYSCTIISVLLLMHFSNCCTPLCAPQCHLLIICIRAYGYDAALSLC
jgi:hypothetical protein